MHVCTYTHPYIHIYFTACGPPKHQRVMSGRRNQSRCKKQVYTTYFTSSQKTRLQKLNSYLVMNSTKIIIERPRNLKFQALTWSDYKKTQHNPAHA